MLRLNADGSEQWRKSYNIGSGSDVFSSIALADDGYVVAGRTNSTGNGSYDALISKIDASGATVMWRETYGGSDYDAAYSVRAAGRGYIAGGKAVGLQWAGGTDMYLIRIGALDHFIYLPLTLRN